MELRCKSKSKSERERALAYRGPGPLLCLVLEPVHLGGEKVRDGLDGLLELGVLLMDVLMPGLDQDVHRLGVLLARVPEHVNRAQT